jgi:ATP-dependent protease ClpP protease subunit
VLGIVDTLLSIKCPVTTVGMGAVYSYSSLLLVGITAG